MARKHKYPRRPYNDGDHWVAGHHHARGRQNRGQPLANVVKVSDTTQRVRQLTNPDKGWETLKPRTIIEMCVKGALSLQQVQSFIKRGIISRVDFRVDFLEAIKEAAGTGEIENPVELFTKYRPALIGWD